MCVWFLSEFLVCASVSSVVCIMGLSACWTSAVVIKAHLLFHLLAFVCSVPFSDDHNTFKADDSKCETYNRYKSPWIYIYCISAHITGYRCLFYKQIYMCTTCSLFLTSDFLVWFSFLFVLFQKCWSEPGNKNSINKDWLTVISVQTNTEVKKDSSSFSFGHNNHKKQKSIIKKNSKIKQ